MAKIIVVGLATWVFKCSLLAQNNEVIGVDICEERVAMLNARKCPIEDKELREYLSHVDLDFKASSNLEGSVKNADYIIISTPQIMTKKQIILIRLQLRQLFQKYFQGN